MNVQTSENRPITVSWILPDQLGLCFCPGKCHMRGGVKLERNLKTDLCRLKDCYNVQCIVCLLNDAELRSYGLRDYARTLAAHGLEYVQHAIVECAAPDDPIATCQLLDQLAQHLQRGQRMVVHCRGGVGRAGLVAACLLLRLGYAATASDAIQEVRRLRCKTAVETRKQEDFVHWYGRHLQENRPAEQPAVPQPLDPGTGPTPS